MAEKAFCSICNRNFKDEAGLAMHNSAVHNNTIPSKKKSKSMFIIIAVVAILVMAVFGYFQLTKSTGNSINTNSGTQQVKISMSGSNYNPNTIKVKANQPVEITLDNSVSGCFRAFKIPSLSVSKLSQSPSDTITFTPTQKGTYTYQCGMGMARGTLIVE